MNCIKSNNKSYHNNIISYWVPTYEECKDKFDELLSQGCITNIKKLKQLWEKYEDDSWIVLVDNVIFVSGEEY